MLTDKQISELAALWDAAKTRMHDDSTPATRKAYRLAAAAYNAVLDAAEQDPTRW